MEIYKLFPECKDYLWGGKKLIEKYGKITEKNICAESWELSFHKDGLTKLENGKTLQDFFSQEQIGKNMNSFQFFPVLAKFIDAKDNLSIQVHPSDDFALKNENSFGKTEMWYIVEADEGAGIYLGLKENVDKKTFQTAIEEKKLTDLLNFYPVKAGECYFIPSGTIHAICKGCLICEIQQNSNLTYRVYDYGRKDKNGKERELHIEKALKVSNLNKFKNKNISIKSKNGNIIGISKYFTTTEIIVSGEKIISADENSYKCLICVAGNGKIDNTCIKMGESFFVPAQCGEICLNGEMKVIMCETRKYYIGIDLGGTFIKGGIVDDLGNILLQDKVPTESEKGQDKVAKNISQLVLSLLEKVNMTSNDVEGIGIGVPGMIDVKNGIVIYSNNLNWKDFSISKEIERQTNLKVKIANDADVAALGETKFGSATNYKNTVLITLGTGVGSGVVINGKLFEGNNSVGAELGHTVLVYNGEQCTCGRKGCFEAYCSATALIRDTKRAMLNDKNSKMWEVGIDNVNGKTPFDFKDIDKTAKEVVDNYINLLACGITNIANALRPEAIILGGGVCAQGDVLTVPIKKILEKEIFAGDKGPKVDILIAKLENSAGILGASALLM